MRFATIASAAAAFAVSVSGLNIVLGNDDGAFSANIRETYRLLKKEGHNVLLVASADNQSGKGGLSVFTSNNTLERPSEYDIIPAGAPSLGTDPADSHIWYYNGTPAACLFIALDYVLPNFTNMSSVDLVVAGPNFGSNLGPFLYTLSGTNGYTYAAVGRGIPAIAISGGNGEQRSYQWINSTTASGFPDPATIQGQLVVNLVQTLINSTLPGDRLLPLGYGLSVNLPSISSLEDDSCIDPPFIQTRMTGNAVYDIAVRNETTGLFHYADIISPGGNACINGYCDLPSETDVLDSGCQSSVTVFTVDYDAPVSKAQRGVRSKLEPLVKYAENGMNSTSGDCGKPGGYYGKHHWPARHSL